MVRKSNKEIEHYYFEMFRNAYPLPIGQIVYEDKPNVVLTGPRKIGIEITRFYLEDGSLSESEQKQERKREEVIKEAQRIYLAEKRKPIEITFGFNKDNPIKSNQNIVNNIVELGRRLEMSENGVILKDLFSEIPELIFVYVNATVYSDPTWQIQQVYNVPIMSKEKLAQIVKRKEKDEKNYQKCDAYWLLVVVDSIDPAQEQEIRVEGIGEVKSEIFERIIVYKPFFDHILEINEKLS